MRDKERQRQLVNLARGRQRRGEVTPSDEDDVRLDPERGTRARERGMPKLGRRRQARVDLGLDPPSQGGMVGRHDCGARSEASVARRAHRMLREWLAE